MQARHVNLEKNVEELRIFLATTSPYTFYQTKQTTQLPTAKDQTNKTGNELSTNREFVSGFKSENESNSKPKESFWKKIKHLANSISDELTNIGSAKLNKYNEIPDSQPTNFVQFPYGAPPHNSSFGEPREFNQRQVEMGIYEQGRPLPSEFVDRRVRTRNYEQYRVPTGEYEDERRMQGNPEQCGIPARNYQGERPVPAHYYQSVPIQRNWKQNQRLQPRFDQRFSIPQYLDQYQSAPNHRYEQKRVTFSEPKNYYQHFPNRYQTRMDCNGRRASMQNQYNPDMIDGGDEVSSFINQYNEDTLPIPTENVYPHFRQSDNFYFYPRNNYSLFQ